MKNPKLIIGGLLLLALVAVALVGPAVVDASFGEEDPIARGTFPHFLHPSGKHVLGTDPDGRDGLAVFLNSIWPSLFLGIIAGAVGTAIGVTVGFTSGYVGGWVNTIFRVIIDMVLVFPTLPLLLVVSLYISKWNLVTMGLLLSAFGWAFTARVVRAQVLSLRERPHVDIARLSNESDLEIIFLELLPSLLPYIGLSMSGAIIGAILAEAGLQLIGIGAGGLPTLGFMIARGFRDGVIGAGLSGQLLAPAGVLILLFLSLNLVNMGLEEIFNPRLRTTIDEG